MKCPSHPLHYLLHPARPQGFHFSDDIRPTYPFSVPKCNKKIQQSWQTSALAMHLPLARLVSMPVIFCLLPSSSTVILVFYLFSTGISEQHVWELWVWIQSTGLTLPPRVTPMNNPITLITSTVAGLHFCCADSCYMRSSANFRIVFSESQNASPLDAELGPDLNAKWPFKVIQGHSRSSVSASVKSH